MINLITALDALSQIVLSEENEDELMEFRNQFGQATAYVLAARRLNLPQYKHIADSFCSADLSPVLREVMEYCYLETMEVTSELSNSLYIEFFSSIEQYNTEITKLAKGYDCNYTSLLVDALPMLGLHSVSEMLGLC